MERGSTGLRRRSCRRSSEVSVESYITIPLLLSVLSLSEQKIYGISRSQEFPGGWLAVTMMSYLWHMPMITI